MLAASIRTTLDFHAPSVRMQTGANDGITRPKRSD